MNLQAYEILSETERCVNALSDCNFTAKFTCPNEAFKFELTSEITGETTVFFVVSDDMPADYADKLTKVIMYGLGYERKKWS